MTSQLKSQLKSDQIHRIPIFPNPSRCICQIWAAQPHLARQPRRWKILQPGLGRRGSALLARSLSVLFSVFYRYGSVSKPIVPLVNIKIAGKWMFIPLKMVLIGIDPYPYWDKLNYVFLWDFQTCVFIFLIL